MVQIMYDSEWEGQTNPGLVISSSVWVKVSQKQDMTQENMKSI